jgi:hypothetical protein
MNHNLTRRQTISLIFLGAFMFILALLFQFTSFKMTEGWEVTFLVFILFPLGLYIGLDPERVRKGK